MREGGLDGLRERLYRAYKSTHAGVSELDAQRPGFRRDIQPHLPSKRQASILDIGCGQGHYVRQLLDLGFESTRGIDISAEQVEQARASGLTQVSLGDYRDSLGVDELDVVIATDFLEHLTRSEALEAMDRIRGSLRPNGMLIVRVPNAASPFGGSIRYGDLTHEMSFTARSLRQLAAATGFSNVEIYACGPPVHGIPSALRAAAWWAAAIAVKAALAAETGQLRGHVVTQNMVAVMRLNEPQRGTIG